MRSGLFSLLLGLIFLSVPVIASNPGYVPGALVQLMAASAKQNGSIVTAEGDVVVFYGDMALQASQALYDANRSILYLEGNVTGSKEGAYGFVADRIKLDLKKEADYFDHYFLTSYQNPLWARGEKAKRHKERLRLSKALISSCDVTCPDWHIEFGSADYNSTTKWLDIWNPRFYVGDMPIFYLPYIGTSLDHRRRTGVLRPTIGLSNRDGFTYEQSLYIAMDPQWDLELTPQYRARRGTGLYGTFRFVDTPYSRGYIKTGYFRSKQRYVDEYRLKNHSHYGWQLHYDSAGVVTKPGDTNRDGLYVDVTYLNDPDYLNLQAVTSEELADSSQVQSRINYFYNTPENYVGLYGRYFIDTSLGTEARKNTYQNAPILQLHHYQTSLFGLGFLQYAADYRYNHFFTENGRHINFQEINLPVNLYGSFFDDYLKFALSENLYYSYSSYHNMGDVLDKAGVQSRYYSLFRNYHTIDIYTDLAKGYEDFMHTMQLRVTYDKPSFSSEKGDTVDAISVLRSPRENLLASSINYFYDQNGEEFLYYRIAQPVLYESEATLKGKYRRYGDLEQEIRYTFMKNYTLYTDLFWSYYLHDVSAATSYFKARLDDYDIMVNHFFKQRENIQSGEKERTSNFFLLHATYRANEHRDYYASVAYNALEDRVNRWGAGTRFFYGCWNLDVGVRDEILPILTSADEADNIHNVTFYFTINLVPFGAFTQAFQQGL